MIAAIAIGALFLFSAVGYLAVRSERARLARIVAATSAAEGTSSDLMRLEDPAGGQISELAGNLRGLGTRLQEQRAELDRRYAQQVMLGKFARQIASTLEQAASAGLAAEACKSVAGADCAVVLVRSEVGKWSVAAARGTQQSDGAAGAPFDDGTVRKLAATREPVVAERYADDEAAAPRAELWVSEGVATVAAWPLVSGGELRGALLAAWRSQRALSAEDAALLSNLAGFAAVAQENARLYARVHELAIQDPVLGVFNRRHFDERMDGEWKRAARYGRHLCLAMIDLDHLKKWNDRYGHDVGDRTLRAVSACIQQNVRGTDVVGRFGGDEILVLMPETDSDGGGRLADRIRERVNELVFEGASEPPSVSIGVAAFPAHASDTAGLFKRADQACFQAKEAGRNRISVAS